MKANEWAIKMATELGTTGPSMDGPTPNTTPKPLAPSVPKSILSTPASSKPPIAPTVGQSAQAASAAMQPATKTAATTALPSGGIGALKAAAAACKKAPRYSMSGKHGKKVMPRPHDRQRKKKSTITKYGEKMAFSPPSPAMVSSAPVPPASQMASSAPVPPASQAQAPSDGAGMLGPELMQGEAQPDIAAHGFGGEMGQPIPSRPQAPQAGAMNSPIIQKLMAQLGGSEPMGLPGAGTGPMGMGDVSGDLSALGVKTAGIASRAALGLGGAALGGFGPPAFGAEPHVGYAMAGGIGGLGLGAILDLLKRKKAEKQDDHNTGLVKNATCGCPVVTRSTKTVRIPSVAPKDNKTASTTDMARSKDFKGAKPVVV